MKDMIYLSTVTPVYQGAETLAELVWATALPDSWCPSGLAINIRRIIADALCKGTILRKG